ncbi:Signal transduction histidine kinase, nitrogen specific [Burkholderiales bacterium]|jgi:two-component system nitrogen regulation sensor histidine kinase GlnL|nr:Signal transduction histidine kinase, nitrogen specific [Burkholderiales bacterium]
MAADSGLDLLAVAVVLVDRSGVVRRANPAAETTFDLSRRLLEGHAVRALFVQSARVDELLTDALAHNFAQRRLLMAVRRPLREPLPVLVIASAVHQDDIALVLELSDPRHQWRAGREQRRADVSEANRRLLRNLAHEIKNPLGGIRGAAQLLETELRTAEQREFTRVIISEADRLQSLLDRVLAPHRGPRVVDQMNIHEVCERVRAVILAEFPTGLRVVRDYDASVPNFRGDREQLIQALLNVVRNSAQALTEQIVQDDARIEIRTRIARQVTFARRHCRLALDLRVIDNGPGVPDEIRERAFDPLVSGREGGSGLGLALAQSYINENDGMIDFESEPGRTEFRILLPLDPPDGVSK